MRTWILVGSMAISESISPGIVFNNTLSYVLIGSFIVGILFDVVEIAVYTGKRL